MKEKIQSVIDAMSSIGQHINSLPSESKLSIELQDALNGLVYFPVIIPRHVDIRSNLDYLVRNKDSFSEEFEQVYELIKNKKIPREEITVERVVQIEIDKIVGIISKIQKGEY